MKEYKAPELEIIDLGTQDIVTASGEPYAKDENEMDIFSTRDI